MNTSEYVLLFHAHTTASATKVFLPLKHLAITSATGHELQTFQACTEMALCLGYSRPRRIVTNLLSCALEAYLITYLHL